MRVSESIMRGLSRPTTLWLCFAVVCLTAGLGLTALSRHVLQLSRSQSESRQRETVQQNLRVALWRLDSRLGPFVATINDLVASDLGSENAQYVHQRFRIASDPGEKQVRFVYQPIVAVPVQLDGASFQPNSNQEWARFRDAISADSVVAAVRRLVPDVDDPPPAHSLSQALVQSYSNVAQGDAISGRELDNRVGAVQQQMAMNFLNARSAPDLPDRNEVGMVKLIPLWIADELVVARSGPRQGRPTLEGAWIDWPALKASLLADIEDIVPGADLVPLSPGEVVDPSRTLAALPVMIQPTRSAPPSVAWLPTHTSLFIAWLAFAAAALVAALALGRLVSLSERRASFVSAVTHELRTPLTTFRLYSDLLARDMVPDPDARKEYLQTLRREADRLTHLVDNVLRYSRLEKTSKRPPTETIVLSKWIERMEPRLSDRLRSADMELVIQLHQDGQWTTDPSAMEQVVFNLIDNAAKYAQSSTDRRVHLEASLDGKKVRISVRDHGPGVPAELVRAVFKPFSKSAERAAETAAGVGLGLALARQTVATLGGTLDYRPAEGGGALFAVTTPDGCG